MTYKSKLTLIKEREKALQNELKQAVVERKHKIGELASKHHLLEESDAFFAGLFSEAF